MKLLLEDKLLNYEKLYVFLKSLYQPEYQCLIEGFKNQLSKIDILSILNKREDYVDIILEVINNHRLYFIITCI